MLQNVYCKLHVPKPCEEIWIFCFFYYLQGFLKAAPAFQCILERSIKHGDHSNCHYGPLQLYRL